MADPQNKVPFPLAGDGAYLRFRTTDLLKLRETYGEPNLVKVKNEIGILVDAYETFTDRIENLVVLNDPKAILDCLKAGLKQEDGRKPLSAIDFDDLPFGIVDARKPILDALSLGTSGKSYAALLDEQKEAAELAARNERLRGKGAVFDGDPNPQQTLADET